MLKLSNEYVLILGQYAEFDEQTSILSVRELLECYPESIFNQADECYYSHGHKLARRLSDKYSIDFNNLKADFGFDPEDTNYVLCFTTEYGRARRIGFDDDAFKVEKMMA